MTRSELRRACRRFQTACANSVDRAQEAGEKARHALNRFAGALKRAYSEGMGAQDGERPATGITGEMPAPHNQDESTEKE